MGQGSFRPRPFPHERAREIERIKVDPHSISPKQREAERIETERIEREIKIKEYIKAHPEHKLLSGDEIHGILGYELCGPLTTDIAKTTLFITSTDLEGLYIHSNFPYRTSKKDVAKASLVVYNGKTFFEEIVESIFIQDRPSERPFLEQRKRQFEKDVRLIIDAAVFNDPSYKTLGLDRIDSRNIRIYCADGSTRKVHKLANGEYVIDYAEKVKTRIGKTSEASFSFLEEPFLFQENYKVLSLVEDRMTNNKLNKLFSQHKLPLDSKRTQEQIKEDLMATLLANKNSLVHILGHIEENSFVTKNAANEVIFRIPVAEINEFQKKNGLAIIYNGCSSALSGAGTGHTVIINSKESLDRIALAHENKKKTNAGFFSDLAPANGYMVIGNDIVNGFATISAEIYSKKTDEPLMTSSLVSAIPYRQISPLESPNPPASQPDHVTLWEGIFGILKTITIMCAILFGSFYLYEKLVPIKPKKK
jgi:hypothetical protein